MSAAQAVSESTNAPPTYDQGLVKILYTCMQRTMDAMSTAGLATPAELTRVRTRYEQSFLKGETADIIETLAKVQGTEEEHMGVEVSRIAHAIAGVIYPSPPLVPFTGKLIAPSAFYESFDQLHKLARHLLAPVVYAEDTDCVGTGALNPIAAQIMADEILASVDRRFGIKPFVTAVRIDYESWTFLNRKHFGL